MTRLGRRMGLIINRSKEDPDENDGMPPPPPGPAQPLVFTGACVVPVQKTTQEIVRGCTDTGFSFVCLQHQAASVTWMCKMCSGTCLSSGPGGGVRSSA